MKSKKTASNKNLILTIYLYFFIGVGLIMMIIGTYGLGQNYYKSNLLPKYPLGGYEERCDYLAQPIPMMKQDLVYEGQDEELAAQYEQQVADCEARLADERATRKLTDFYNSLITLSIGLVIFAGHLVVNLKVSRR